MPISQQAALAKRRCKEHRNSAAPCWALHIMIALSAQRRGILIEITKRAPGLSCQGDIGVFLDCYFVAEVLARKVSSFYQDDTNKPSSDKIQVQQLGAAIRHFGIVFPEADIRKLFLGGEGPRGTKSARQLRNGYVHGLSVEDQSEIERMTPVFVNMLKSFFSAICA